MCDRMHEERRGAAREQSGKADLASALSRREFVGGVAAVAATAVLGAKPATLLAAGEAPQSVPQSALHAAAARAAPAQPRAPVVGFRMDRPFLDPTGMAEPYVPASGTRSGQVLAELTEHEFLSRHPYG